MNNYELEAYLNELLNVKNFKDYAPNGLQIEGKTEIKKVICAVTASLELIDAAIKQSADAIFVHHGYFWKNESSVITHHKRNRIKRLIESNINLFAYHLPLDAHPEIGNNAQLAKLWQIDNPKPTNDQSLLWMGSINPTTPDELSTKISTSLNRPPLHIPVKRPSIQKIAWCSGAAQNMLEEAALAGADAFISGEVSEQTYHLAKEYNIHYYAAGHHATEKYGPIAIAEHLTEKLELDTHLIDCLNPI